MAAVPAGLLVHMAVDHQGAVFMAVLQSETLRRMQPSSSELCHSVDLESRDIDLHRRRCPLVSERNMVVMMLLLYENY